MRMGSRWCDGELQWWVVVLIATGFGSLRNVSFLTNPAEVQFR